MLCGIDEAGRGCLAGNLCVAGCILNAQIKGLKDSKKLTHKKRVELFYEIKSKSDYKIIEFTSEDVDNFGISDCIKKALLQIKDYFKNSDFIFDGNTSFGVSGIKTLIKADTSIIQVSAASILAKVSRDLALIECDKKYPYFKFLQHKGYGTKLHIEMIKKYGYTEFHRKSFKIKNINK